MNPGPALEELLIQSRDMPWRDEATGATIALIKFDKGSGIPAPH